MTIERTAEFDAPIDRVYTLLVDDARLAEWRDGLVSHERVSPPGPLDGATYRETLKTPMGQQSATVRISARENASFGFEVLDGAVRPKGLMTLTDLGERTRVVYRIDLKPMFGVPSPLDAAAGAFLTSGMEKSLARLKTLLESAR